MADDRTVDAFAERADGSVRSAARPAGTAEGLLVEVSEALDADLELLDAAGWNAPVVNGWDVFATIVHLTAVHEVALQRLSGNTRDHVTARDLDMATARLSDLQRHHGPFMARELWRASVGRLREAANDHTRRIDWLGLDISTETCLVDRAFETWIHANDVRRAINRASLDPSGSHFRVLCDFVIDIWPLTLAARGHTHDARVVVNLAGPGGGVWTMPIGAATPNAAEFSFHASARDVCLLMGSRIDPADFAFVARGHDLAAVISRDLIEHAASFNCGH